MSFGVSQGILDVKKGKGLPGRGESLNKGISVFRGGALNVTR